MPSTRTICTTHLKEIKYRKKLDAARAQCESQAAAPIETSQCCNHGAHLAFLAASSPLLEKELAEMCGQV